MTSTIAVISNFVRDSAIKVDSADEKSIFTIYIRLPHRLPEVDARQIEQILERLGLIAQSYLLYPANFWPHKNHERLLTAFALAGRNGLSSHVKLVCTGAPGERMCAVADAAETLGMRDTVLFPGFLSAGEFSALMKS